jgi:hypothetical protein
MGSWPSQDPVPPRVRSRGPLLSSIAGETLLRKLGRFDMVRKQSVPEIVFAYFHNK